METNAQRWTTVILLIGEASGVFAGFCPSWFTVASPFFHEQEAKAGNVSRIRWGEGSCHRHRAVYRCRRIHFDEG